LSEFVRRLLVCSFAKKNRPSQHGTRLAAVSGGAQPIQ
jgi:hypothetical protein